MSDGVMSVGEITVGVMTVGIMTVGVMRRPLEFDILHFQGRYVFLCFH